MKLTKKAKIIAAGGISFLIVGGSAIAVAATDTNSTNRQALIDKVTKKTSLDSTTVGKVLDAAKEVRQEDRQAKLDEKLDAEVKAGNITADQKIKIDAKLKELEANRPDFSKVTKEQRITAMEKQKTDLKEWAKENGIDLTKIMPFGHMIGGHKHGMFKDNEIEDKD